MINTHERMYKLNIMLISFTYIQTQSGFFRVSSNILLFTYILNVKRKGFRVEHWFDMH